MSRGMKPLSTRTRFIAGKPKEIPIRYPLAMGRSSALFPEAPRALVTCPEKMMRKSMSAEANPESGDGVHAEELADHDAVDHGAHGRREREQDKGGQLYVKSVSDDASVACVHYVSQIW